MTVTAAIVIIAIGNAMASTIKSFSAVTGSAIWGVASEQAGIVGSADDPVDDVVSVAETLNREGCAILITTYTSAHIYSTVHCIGGTVDDPVDDVVSVAEILTSRGFAILTTSAHIYSTVYVHCGSDIRQPITAKLQQISPAFAVNP